MADTETKKKEQVTPSPKETKAESKEVKEESTDITAYEAMDLVDESQIVNEIEGKVIDEAMVYSFIDKTTGKEITGLSWKGTKAVWWALNKEGYTKMTITDKVIITQGSNHVDVAVYAFDDKRKIGAWGMARGYTKLATSRGEVEDRFTSAKAMSKAQRNALNQLLPMESVAKMIKLFIKKGKVQVLTPTVVSQVRQQVGQVSQERKFPTQQELLAKFNMNSSQIPPKCPNCEATMMLRQRKDGSGIFWSCANWNTKGCKGYNVDEVDIDGTFATKNPPPKPEQPKPELPKANLAEALPF